MDRERLAATVPARIRERHDMTSNALHRKTLPQTKGGLYLTDGGLETYMVFDEGIELPCFASFPLLEQEKGHDLLSAYFARYLKIAADNNLGFVLDTATWRANTDWAAKLGYDSKSLASINRAAVAFAANLRAIVANAGGEGPTPSDAMVERLTPAGATGETVKPLSLVYPPTVFSLSHLAIPFPLSDPLYGLQPDLSEDYGANLGAMATRGERGILVVSIDSLARMSSNPFFDFVMQRIEDGIRAR